MPTPAKPMLGDIELQLVQQIQVDSDQVLVRHGVPALEGDLLQRLDRRAVRITLSGVLTGQQAGPGLNELREKFRAAEPTPFVADIATATRVDQVLIQEMSVRELAGKPERFEYAFTLAEYIPPPVAREEPPEIPEPESPADQIDQRVGTLTVEVTVDGQPEFDFSHVTVTVEGTQEDGSSLSHTLTNRSENLWTEESFPAGSYTIRATANPRPLSGLAQATTQPGQTTQVPVTLHPTSNIARTFIVHFRFDRAFVEPCMLPVLRQVARYARDHSSERLVVVGHTDKAGSGNYNQSLSERRARAVFALLSAGVDQASRDAALAEWNDLRQERPRTELPSIKDSWGAREYQHVLGDLGFYPGPVDGRHGPLTDDAVRAYRCHKGLPAGTVVDDDVWQALIEDYLTRQPLAVPASQFFPNCTGEILKWLGCGEEDPLDRRSTAFRPSRRVELIFVQTDQLSCQIPRPVTFELPEAGRVNSDWCVGPETGSSRCCLLSPHLRPASNDPAPCTPAEDGPWCRQPAEPGTITVQGSIQREREDGSFEPAAGQAFVLTAPNGAFKASEQSNGEPTPARTGSDGTFSFADMPLGFYSLEVIAPSTAPVLVRLQESNDADIKGNAVCKALRSDQDRLEVVIVRAPVLREIRLPVAVHLMTALHPATREVRTCPDPLNPARRVPQRTRHSEDDIQRFFEGANRIWRQARIRFQLDSADIVREAYSFRTECDVDDSEFGFILERCAYQKTVNVFFIADLAGQTEAGVYLKVTVTDVRGTVDGCAVSDRFQFTIFTPAPNVDLNDDQAIQVLAHELGHYLSLEHVNNTPANADRLMLPSSFSGANRTLGQEEIDRARASPNATDSCVPLTLQVTGATRVGGSLSDKFIVIQSPGAVVTVDAQIPDRLLDPARGALVMTGGNAGANDRQRTVSAATTGVTEVVATYTPAGGGQPVISWVLIRVATLNLEVDGACRVGGSSSTTFIASVDSDPNAQVRITARLDPAPFCIPDNLVGWEEGNETPDPIRRVLPRASAGRTTVRATVASTTRSVTILVSTFSLRVEEATRVGPAGSTIFATTVAAGASVTIIAELNPAPAPVPPGLITWTPSTASPDPLRQTVSRARAAEIIVRAELCGTTRQVTIQVLAEVDRITKTDPVRPSFDEISDPNEPVLTVCGTDTARLRIEITPDAAQVFYTTTPDNVVNLNPAQRTGDGEVTVQPRPLPSGTNRVNGRDTRLSVRIFSATGPEVSRNGHPARVRIRQFERIDAHLFLHIVRDDDGNLAGTSLEAITNNFNTALAEANTLWSRACIRLVPRRLPNGQLNIDFIDETDLLDITATFDGQGGVTFPDNEDQDLYTQGGTDRNAANPTFINLYLIDRFAGAGTLGGFSSGNALIIERTMSGSLLAHELGHNMGLRDLDKVAGITDLNRRLMRSGTPRGDILTSNGTAGDEIHTARNRATRFTG